MPIATPDAYAAMLQRAKDGGFAYPAINVTSSETINAALRGFADAGSDGIIQVSTGGAEFASGTKVKDMVTGAVALAEFAKVVADKYGITVALHTDHCPKDKLDTYVKPLIAISTERVKAGGNPLFQSHMWDGSAVPLDENLAIAKELLPLCRGREHHPGDRDRRGRRRGGRRRRRDEREDVHLARRLRGHRRRAGRAGGQLHRRRDVRQRARRVQAGQRQAASRGAPEGQDALAAKLGLEAGAKPFALVFHGGSGSSAEEIAEAVSYGVVKMNIDTDTQYAFTRPLVGHFFTNYDGVLKIDGEVGNKKAYDPRAYLKLGEAGMADRIVEACQQLGSAGTSPTA